MASRDETPPDAGPALAVWLLSDAKAGHVRQSRSLCAALAEVLASSAPPPAGAPARLSVTEVPAPRLSALRHFVTRLRRHRPALIVGAGHATHAGLLAARLARPTRSIVIMRPTLPLTAFDLALIPAHDRPRPARRVVVTDGPLCPPAPAETDREPASALVLIGGPSRHYRWDSSRIAREVAVLHRSLLATTPELRLTVTDSRRTPAGALTDIASAVPEAETVSFRETDDDWLPRALARTGSAWVTPDSVSMLYEAASACDSVGVLALEPAPGSRVAARVAALVAAGRIGRAAETGVVTASAPRRYDEARRVARLIVETWLPTWGFAG